MNQESFSKCKLRVFVLLETAIIEANRFFSFLTSNLAHICQIKWNLISFVDENRIYISGIFIIFIVKRYQIPFNLADMD